MCCVQDGVSDSNETQEQMFQHFHEWTSKLCEEKPFTKFWIQEFLFKHCLHFNLMQEAIRCADAYTMEVIMRQSVPLFKQTMKHRYVFITLFALANILTRSPKVVEMLRFNRGMSLTGRERQDVGLDVKVEKCNLFTKEVTTVNASCEWYRTVTSIQEVLQSSHAGTRSEFDMRRRLHFDPLMDADKNTVDKLCTNLAMFKVEGKSLPLCNLFEKKAASVSGTEGNKYWETIATIQRSVDKSTFTVVGVLQERTLAVKATKYKQDLALIIGREEVPVFLKEGHTNPAHVYSYAPRCDVEGTQQGAGEGLCAVSMQSEESLKDPVPGMFTQVSQLNSVRASLYMTQYTLEHAMAVQEYASQYLGAGGINKFLREVLPFEGEAHVMEFVVKQLSGSDLLFEGLKVSITDLEACKLAELDWMADAAERKGTAEEARAGKAALEKHIATCKAKLREDIRKSENRCRWRAVQKETGDMTYTVFEACNKRKVDVLSLARQGKLEGGVLADRICEGGRIAVDAWSCKTSKMTFPAGSLWKAFVTQLHIASLSDGTERFEKGAGLRELGGVGEKTAMVLSQTFGLKTVGSLAELTAERAAEIQARIKKEGLVRNMAAGKMLALVLAAQILVTTALMEVADDEEDDDDGHLLHATEANEAPSWDSYS
jgi:hypothetical protein